MSNNPAIVVSAYNRPNSFSRLLKSIANGAYNDNDITLFISIDNSDDKDVFAIADSFVWTHGKKEIVFHDCHLGLKEHILRCGDLTSRFDSLIMLEDDLLVSPFFYEYAKQAVHFYEEEESVAGISLYNYQVAENCFYPFQAIDDGSDVYFMQVASSWGQVWTKQQWQGFRNWFALNPEITDNSSIPDYLKFWGKHSWKKHFIHYLIDTNKYFVFPRLSLSTNFEEEGTNSSSKNIFHVTLQTAATYYNFQQLVNAKSKYDAWFEIQPSSLNHYNINLSQYEYEVDLYQTKAEYAKKYVLTSKIAQNPILSYSSELFPLETNTVFQLVGNDISLYDTSRKTFLSRKLNLRNYLEEINEAKALTVSIVIPIIHVSEVELKKTLNSLEHQSYPFIEIILVISQNNYAEIEKIVSYYSFKIKILVCSNDDIDQLVFCGLNVVEDGITAWVNQGVVFRNVALQNINSIFKSYASINWICGIDGDPESLYEYDRLDVFNYRLAPIELYNRAKKGGLSYSTENHFFRSECLKTFTGQDIDLKKFFFHLFNHFQLTVVVKCLVLKGNNKVDFSLNKEDCSLLIAKYKPVISIASIKAKWFNWLLHTPIIGHSSYKWYYTSLHNFPDVLRYDSKCATFYLSKY